MSELVVLGFDGVETEDAEFPTTPDNGLPEVAPFKLKILKTSLNTNKKSGCDPH